jgi:hypothetical protein
VVGLAKEKENEKTKMIGSGGVGWGTMKQCWRPQWRHLYCSWWHRTAEFRTVLIGKAFRLWTQWRLWKEADVCVCVFVHVSVFFLPCIYSLSYMSNIFYASSTLTRVSEVLAILLWQFGTPHVW